MESKDRLVPLPFFGRLIFDKIEFGTGLDHEEKSKLQEQLFSETNIACLQFNAISTCISEKPTRLPSSTAIIISVEKEETSTIMIVEKRPYPFLLFPLHRGRLHRRFSISVKKIVTKPWLVLESSNRSICPAGGKHREISALYGNNQFPAWRTSYAACVTRHVDTQFHPHKYSRKILLR